MKPVYLLLLPAILILAACGDTPDQSSAADNQPAQDPPRLSANVELAGTSPVVSDPAARPAGQTSDPASTTAPATGGTQELEWDALIPDDYRPDKLMADYGIDSLADDDPRAAELMDKLRELWDQAPVREDLDGQQIKLPGFIVPVEADDEETTGFLLVPYYGACIHVPPPPANQTVYVVTEAGKGTAPELFDVIWVTGTMSVNRVANDIAEAGYTLYATDIAPYE